MCIRDSSLSADKPVELTVEFSSEKSVFLHGVQLGLQFPIVGDLLERAVDVAANCDAAVVVVGTNADWETEGRDREFMELPGNQPDLIRRVCEVNPNTVVVVNSGSVVTTDWADIAPAVLQTWFGGQEMSHALVDVLTGAEEPGGRLPNTWPHRLEDTPAFINYPGEAGVVNYGEGVFVGYRWYQARDIDVAFSFGHGLGYTTFEWGDPVVSGAKTIEELENSDQVASLAVNLVGVDHNDLARGSVLTRSHQWYLTSKFDGDLFVLNAVDHDISRRGAYLVYLGSGEYPAKLRVLGPESIFPGEQGKVRIFIDNELPLMLGDRYILRDSGRGETIGGGAVSYTHLTLPTKA